MKNPDQTVGQLIAETAKAVGDTIAIARFVRLEVGGGAEDKAE